MILLSISRYNLFFAHTLPLLVAFPFDLYQQCHILKGKNSGYYNDFLLPSSIANSTRNIRGKNRTSIFPVKHPSAGAFATKVEKPGPVGLDKAIPSNYICHVLTF